MMWLPKLSAAVHRRRLTLRRVFTWSVAGMLQRKPAPNIRPWLGDVDLLPDFSANREHLTPVPNG